MYEGLAAYARVWLGFIGVSMLPSQVPWRGGGY